MSFKGFAGVARAPFLILPVTLVAVGSGVAYYQDAFHLLHALLALVGLVALHAAVNAFNEASDFKSGIDFDTVRTPFSGGSGTLPAGQLSYKKALGVGIAGSVIGLAVGVYFLVVVGWKLLPIMAVGLVAVLFYTDFLARSYVGEIFAGLGLGNMPVLGTIMVQTGEIDALAIAASIPAFFMTFNLLLLNEFPDAKADRKGGRRNLVLLLNQRAAAGVYAAAALMVPACLFAAVILDYLPRWGLLALIPSLLLVAPLRWAIIGPERPVPEAALGANVIWILSTNAVLAGALLVVTRNGALDLGPDSVHLWYVFSDESGPADRYARLLSSDERLRMERHIKPDARHRFAVAHALVRSALLTYTAVEPLEWRFESGPHGKPEIAWPTGIPPLRFNLSHTAGLSACAVALGRDIGVDVEMTGRETDRKEIARRFFAPEEAAAIEKRPESFFDYWTLKESFIKARGEGEGMSMGLSNIAFRLEDDGEASLMAGPDGWRFFRDAPSDSHVCAVALQATAEEPLELTILRYPHSQD